MVSRLSKVLFLIFIFSSAGVLANESESHRDVPNIEKMSLERLKELELSKDQREKLKEIRERHRNDGTKLQEELEVAKKNFQETLRSNANREQVLKAFDLMSEKKRECAKSRLNGLIEAREILTVEQRQKLFDN